MSGSVISPGLVLSAFILSLEQPAATIKMVKEAQDEKFPSISFHSLRI